MAELIPGSEAAAELSLDKPGSILSGAARLDFGGAPQSPFLVRLEARPFCGPEPAQVLEVHQPHPRGSEWATLEFAVGALPESAVVDFDARLLPDNPVVLKLYTRSSERDVEILPLNHRINRFRATIDAGLARLAAEDEDPRIGFTLPRRTWFIFQIANLTIRPEAETDAA